MYERNNSPAKKQQTSYNKTPPKSKSKSHLTVDKYLNAKLQYSDKKKMTIEKLSATKDQRIKQLEYEIIQNQQLVRQTLKKWEQYKFDVQTQKMKQETDIAQLQNKVKNFKQSFERTQKALNNKFQVNIKLKQQNQQLKVKNQQSEQKYNNIFRKYQEDRKQWKEVCQYVNIIVSGMQKMPAEVLQKYFP